MRPKGLRVNASSGTPELYVYDEIGPTWAGMISGESIIRALKELGNPRRVTVRINSPGGDVFEGFAIYNALVRHGAEVTVEVDALAASAASLVAMAGNRIRIAANAMMMVHRAWVITAGNAYELQQMADLLQQVDGNLADTYAARTKNSRAKVDQLMDAETWLTAHEAVREGFADEVGQALNLSARVPTGRFRNTPARLQPSGRGASNVDSVMERLHETKERLYSSGVLTPGARPSQPR